MVKHYMNHVMFSGHRVQHLYYMWTISLHVLYLEAVELPPTSISASLDQTMNPSYVLGLSHTLQRFWVIPDAKCSACEFATVGTLHPHCGHVFIWVFGAYRDTTTKVIITNMAATVL
jgi:hypothetical protein